MLTASKFVHCSGADSHAKAKIITQRNLVVFWNYSEDTAVTMSDRLLLKENF